MFNPRTILIASIWGCGALCSQTIHATACDVAGKHLASPAPGTPIPIPANMGFGPVIATGIGLRSGLPTATETISVQPNTVCCNSPCRVKGYAITPGTATAAPATAPPITTTYNAANVYSTFASTMLTTVSADPSLNTQFGTAGAAQVAWLSTEMYRNGTEAQVANLMMYFAQRLSGHNMAVVRTTFGTGVDNYIRAYAPAATQTAYFEDALVTSNSVQPQSAWAYEIAGVGAWIPPEFNMTVNDMWWEEFAKVGATVQSASVSVALKVGGRGVLAYQFGYWVGGYIYIWLDDLDPNINIEIGNIEGAAVNTIVNMVTIGSGTGYVDLPDFYSLVDGSDFDWSQDWYWWYD